MVFILRKINCNLGQISFFETVFISLLFALVLGVIVNNVHYEDIDYEESVKSFLDSVYYLEDFRSNILNEDLSIVPLSENWTNLSLLLSNSFSNYEFIILNGSYSKKIFSCVNGDEKVYVEKIISIGISNTDNFDFRRIRLGVCY